MVGSKIASNGSYEREKKLGSKLRSFKIYLLNEIRTQGYLESLRKNNISGHNQNLKQKVFKASYTKTNNKIPE